MRLLSFIIAFVVCLHFVPSCLSRVVCVSSYRCTSLEAHGVLFVKVFTQMRQSRTVPAEVLVRGSAGIVPEVLV
jgi:hypothetical protein